MTGEGLDARFGRRWAASTLSALGSGMATVAAPLYAAARSDDPLEVAAAAGAAWLPWLLFALPGGVLADRLDRRRLMVVIDWVRVVGGGTTLAQGMLAGPLGGLLFVLAESLPFLVNAGTYALSALLVALIAGSYRGGLPVPARPAVAARDGRADRPAQSHSDGRDGGAGAARDAAARPGLRRLRPAVHQHVGRWAARRGGR